jgi:two-component system cell cycle sensor histidine kinase/response regulator CckA
MTEGIQGLERTQTVLLVEDCDDSRFVFRKMLETLGYRAIVACDAEEAIRMSQNHDGAIDLLLADVMLPGMNGRVLADLLTESDPSLSVVLMSGYPAERVACEGKRFLQKPFTTQQAAVIIRQALDAVPARFALG